MDSNIQYCRSAGVWFHVTFPPQNGNVLTICIQIWFNDCFPIKYFYKNLQTRKKQKPATCLDKTGLIWGWKVWSWQIGTSGCREFKLWIQEVIFFFNSFKLHELAHQQYCISFQLSHNLFTAARRQYPLGNFPSPCNVTSCCIFHLATADRCDKIANSQATLPTGPTEAIPTAAQKKDCKLFHAQVKLFQVNLHSKFSLQRHLYFSMYHRAVLGWFYLGSKQHFKL